MQAVKPATINTKEFYNFLGPFQIFADAVTSKTVILKSVIRPYSFMLSINTLSRGFENQFRFS